MVKPFLFKGTIKERQERIKRLDVFWFRKTGMIGSTRRDYDVVLYCASVHSSCDGVGEEKLPLTLLGFLAGTEEQADRLAGEKHKIFLNLYVT